MPLVPKIVVHHLQFSRSSRIIWLLEELKLPYTVQMHYRSDGGFASSTLKQASRMGKSPTIVYDGEVMTESGSIVHQLMKLHPSPALQYPPSTSSTFFSHYAEATLMLYLQPARFAELGARKLRAGAKPTLDLDPLKNDDERRGMEKQLAWFTAWARSSVEPALAEADAFLADNANFSGEERLGEGDFMMMFPLNSIAYGGRKRLYDLGDATVSWVDAIRNRPAWIKAQERMVEEEEGQKSPEQKAADAEKRPKQRPQV